MTRRTCPFAAPAEQAPTLTGGALPGPISDLLAAIRDALDVPVPDRPADDQARAALLTRRAADTRVIVELLLTRGDIAHHTARLREWTAEHPVSYPTWQERSEQAAAEEAQMLTTQAYTGDPGEGRCPAAHPDDPTPCDGPPVVTVLDAANAGADGCAHHGARLLASLKGGRVYGLPDAPAGTAIRIFKAADGIRPFPWLTDAPRTEPGQLSHAENRRGG